MGLMGPMMQVVFDHMNHEPSLGQLLPSQTAVGGHTSMSCCYLIDVGVPHLGEEAESRRGVRVV